MRLFPSLILMGGVALLFGPSSVLSAQSLQPQFIGTAGAHAAQGNVRLSYSIGEVVVASLTADTLLLTQGFQQPFSGGPVSTDPISDGWQLAVFPNPSSGTFYLRPGGLSGGVAAVEIVLHHADGREVLRRPATLTEGDDLAVPTAGLPSGAYFLTVVQQGRSLFGPARLTFIDQP
ncbi:MAG: T9SS type A sorting domain-containing protein [Saprospiraceae bacterium]|nr:T9SS type A sorting domain-containing protein [Saprospiraceae bacterium]